MEASTTTVCGGRPHKRALELHEDSAAATTTTPLVAGADRAYTNQELSKRINLGHNSGRVAEHMEASTMTVRGGQRKNKGALELRLYQDDYDDEEDDDHEYEVREATFVVTSADSAYSSMEMPKRINLGYNVGETSARFRALEAENERDVAMEVHRKSLVAAMIRDMYAKAAAAAAASAPRST